MSSKGFRRSWGLVLIGLSACGGKPAEDATDAQAERTSTPPPKAQPAPVDVKALLARESTTLSTRSIADKQGAWSADVPSDAAPTSEEANGIVMVNVPVGAEEQVRCQAFSQELGAGAVFHSVLANAPAGFEFGAVQPAGVKVIRNAPASYLDAQYTGDSPKGRVFGLLKMAFYAREGGSLLCVHDEVGYRKTFTSVADGFFESFKRQATSDQQPQWLEVSKTRMETTDLAVSVTKIFAGARPGEHRYESMSASFMPTSPKDLVLEDTVTKMELDARGKLQEGVWTVVEGGELALQMTLSAAKNKLTYEGTVSGKPVKGELNPKNALTSPLEAAALLKKQLSTGKAFKQVLYEYHPSIDPTALVPVTYAHEAGADPHLVQMTLGEMQMQMKVDAAGMPETATIPMAGRTMQFTREYVTGSL